MKDASVNESSNGDRILKTSRAALCLALLQGRVINLKNCFKDIGLSNPAREIPRMIEDPFHVEVSRVEMIGKTRYGTRCTWVNYRLNKTTQNKEGIDKMWEYVDKHCLSPVGKIVDAPAVEEVVSPEIIQTDLFNGS